ncbi:2-dehydro-3-deoxyglucarate aldolase [Actinomadura darangshiensis]|uniref:2-dehydro-3-deoxyglucarate aldolase n=1 Tax=Actinomadura darangshiensis TaxID=705336 RepID=A0A4R5BM14_9ACTN|nr:aldolase/citrate lyase family protein [Actinomadura darangshiensis]TDD86849.1 2-dehydro-3-deoxyglucarate aldolase [Actinomadura darangshiensis]
MRRLRARVRAGETLLGGLLRMPGEMLVELSGVAGLDYVVIDCEHGPADLVHLQHHIVAAEARGLDVLVRVAPDDPDLVLRVLDLGAAGIIVPHVDTAGDARRAVAAAHYPPLGGRGFATYSRAGRYGSATIKGHLAEAAETTLVVVMLESPAGCANAAEILAVEGVDAVMPGPADLSVAMGLTGGPSEPAVREAIQAVRAAAAAAGRAQMTIVGGAPQAAAAPPGLIVYNLAHVLLTTFRGLNVR